MIYKSQVCQKSRKYTDWNHKYDVRKYVKSQVCHLKSQVWFVQIFKSQVCFHNRGELLFSKYWWAAHLQFEFWQEVTTRPDCWPCRWRLCMIGVVLCSGLGHGRRWVIILLGPVHNFLLDPVSNFTWPRAYFFVRGRTSRSGTCIIFWLTPCLILLDLVHNFLHAGGYFEVGRA